MRNGDIYVGHHSFVFNQNDFVYKAYHRKPTNRSIFPDVELCDLAEYEARVYGALKGSSLNLPEKLEIIRPDVLRDLVSLIDYPSETQINLLDHLDSNPNVPCIRKSYVSDMGYPENSFDILNNELINLRKLGFEMKDYGYTTIPLNVAFNESGLVFYDFKSFFPIIDSTKLLFKDLIVGQIK